jgi:hypothetical protein
MLSLLSIVVVVFFSSSVQGQSCSLAPQVGGLPQVACVRSCCNTPGKRILEFRLSDEYSEFDCPGFHSSVLIRLRNPNVCYYTSAGAFGTSTSTSVTALEVDEDIANAVMTEPRDVGVSTLVDVTDPVTGRSIATDRGLALGWIFFIIFWMLLLVAVVMIVALCYYRSKLRENRLPTGNDVPKNAWYVEETQGDLNQMQTTQKPTPPPPPAKRGSSKPVPPPPPASRGEPVEY